jgi:Flp pilus assembly pilin Flp
MSTFNIYAAILQITGRISDRVSLPRDERGQTTAEYALVIVAAGVIGTMLIAWASKTDFIGSLFDLTLGRVIKAAR